MTSETPKMRSDRSKMTSDTAKMVPVQPEWPACSQNSWIAGCQEIRVEALDLTWWWGATRAARSETTSSQVPSNTNDPAQSSSSPWPLIFGPQTVPRYTRSAVCGTVSEWYTPSNVIVPVAPSYL